MGNIKFTPTASLSYDYTEEKYWDKSALRDEIDRTFEICSSCRLCFKYCDSFPKLFNFIDNNNIKATQLTEDQIGDINDSCFQCKICYFKCPYTKADGHEFNLDFPRLILRYRAQKVKEKGLPINQKIMSNPDLIGKIGNFTAPFSNWANKNSLNRTLMEKTAGIHRKKDLPEFAIQTFCNWFGKNKNKFYTSDEECVDKVILFHTCFGNFNNTEIAKDTVFVLHKNKIKIEVPDMNCCGMPALEKGDTKFAKSQALQNFNTLFPYVVQGYKIVVLNPTCSLTMKDEYPQLLKNEFEKEKLENWKKSVFDLNEYLFTLKREQKFNREFSSTPGKITYHVACHLRAQNIGYRSRDMMRLIPGTSFTLVEECSGHDGTWSMMKDNFENSMKIGSKAFEKITGSEHDIVASDCPLAAIQLKQGTGETVLHPIQVLAKAYKPDGFPNKIINEKNDGEILK